MGLFRKNKTKLHTVNAAAWQRHNDNAARIRHIKETPRDAKVNLAGVQQARAALRQRDDTAQPA